jgi:hypothetical protein
MRRLADSQPVSSRASATPNPDKRIVGREYGAVAPPGCRRLGVTAHAALGPEVHRAA